MSDNHHDDYQAAYRGMLEEISNDEELDGRVMARVHDLRSVQQGAEDARRATGRRTSATRRVPRPRSSVCTRRAIVTAGAAIAGCALLGVAVPLARTLNMRGPDESKNPDSTQMPADAARGQGATPYEGVQSFGLAVANADEVGAGTRATFELAPTSSGLVPVELSATTSVLMLNLATTGAGLEYLNYVIQQAPDAEGPYPLGGSLDEITSAIYFQPWYPYVEMADEQAASTSRDASSQKVTRYTPNQAQAQPNSIPDWVTPEQRESYVSYSPASTSFAATPYAHASGNDGTMLRQGMDSDDPSAAHQMIIVRIPKDEFWQSDPILSLFRAWIDATPYGYSFGEAGLEALTRASRELADYATMETPGFAELSDALCELAADGQALYDWIRSCYQTHMRLMGETLAQAEITAGANFRDGTYQRRAYRIEPVEGLDEVVGERFDAMLELTGRQTEPDTASEAHVFDLSGFPFWDFVSGEPPQDIDDPRLSAPLFTITDVTDEGA